MHELHGLHDLYVLHVLLDLHVLRGLQEFHIVAYVNMWKTCKLKIMIQWNMIDWGEVRSSQDFESARYSTSAHSIPTHINIRTIYYGAPYGAKNQKSTEGI